MGDPNAVAVLWVVMAVTAFGPRGDAPRDVDDDVTPALLFHRPTMFQDDEVEMEDRVGTLQTAVHDVVGHGFLPECAEVLRDIVFRTHLDISFWAVRRPAGTRGAYDRAASARCKGRAGEAACLSYRPHPWR